MTNQQGKHLLSKRMERWPVFRLELATARLRRAERFKKFNRLFRSPLARIILGVLMGASFLLIIGAAGPGTLIDLIGRPTLIILGYVLLPIYACYTALLRGADSLSKEAVERWRPEWVAVGIPPWKIAREILLARALLLMPTAIAVAVLYICTHLIFSASATVYYNLEPDLHVGFILSEFLSHSREVGLIFFALILALYMFFFTAAYLGAVARSTVGRVALVFGYLIAHMVVPVLLSDFVFTIQFALRPFGDSDFFSKLMTAIHPLGTFSYAIMMYSGVDVSSIAKPGAGFAMSAIFQLLFAYLFYSLAVRVFTRRLTQKCAKL